jgi:riboflavin biosynthesis pyrimidine reductase
MTVPPSLEVLYEGSRGQQIPLPPVLEDAYGGLMMPSRESGAYVFSNYVQTVDGVVTLESGKSSGGPISGSNEHDRMVMGLLRAVADAVIVGAGTLRSVPHHIWTSQYIYPSLSGEYAELRDRLEKPHYPLNVIVSGSGRLDPKADILNQDDVPVLVITTREGAKQVPRTRSAVEVVAATKSGDISPAKILEAVARACEGRVYLLEAGPSMLGQFLAAGLVDELFLTLAPQIAGRDEDEAEKRPGLVVGKTFAPEDPLWATLLSIRRGSSHLFLRYAFSSDTRASGPSAAR